MHANLVGAPGFEPALDERAFREAFDGKVMRARRLAALPDDRHLRALHGMATERGIHRAAGRDLAMHQREVVALHRARLQLAHQVGLRGERLRHDHESGRFLVEPMHDAGARQLGEFRRMVQQCVHQRARGVAVARMDDQSRRLVDDDERRVLVDDRQRDVLGGIFESRLPRDGTGDGFAAMHLALGIGRGAVEPDQALLEPALQAAARMLGKQLCQGGVEAQAGALGRNGYLGDFAIIGRLHCGFAHHA